MPIDRIVVNASPLITLFKSQLADLLQPLFQEPHPASRLGGSHGGRRHRRGGSTVAHGGLG